MELISLLFDHHRAKAAYEAGLSKAPTLITLEGEGKNNVWGKKMLRMMLKEVLNKQHGFSKGESWGSSRFQDFRRPSLVLLGWLSISVDQVPHEL